MEKKKFRIKPLLRYILPYKWYAVQNILYNLLGAFFSLFTFTMVIPFLRVLFGKVDAGTLEVMPVKPEYYQGLDYLGELMNYYLEMVVFRYGTSKALLFISLGMVIASLLRNGFIFAANNCMAPIRAYSVRDIRNDVYHKVLRLPLSYFNESRKGDVLTRVSSDVSEIENTVIFSLNMLFRDPITIIVFLIYMFASSYQLTLGAMILLPVSGYFIGKLGRSLRASSYLGQEKLGSLLSVFEETLSGMRIIKAFNGERKMSGNFTGVNQHFSKILKRVIRKRYLASPISEFLSTIVLMVLIYYGGTLVLNDTGSMNSEEFIVYLIVFTQIISPAKNITTSYFNIQKGLASMERIMEILEAEERIIESPNAKPKKEFTESIRYDKVSFAYGNEPVLRDIELDIRLGQTIAIVGKSGSGKSTMVDLLPRFMDVKQGGVLIDGMDIRDMRIRDLRRMMGIVSQQAILFNDTFFNNIAFVANGEVKEEDVIQAAKVANAHEFIMETEKGYETMVGEGGNRLSGGQRQRISIARAVYANPPILILDEATSALDTESERLVQDAIEKLMQNRTSIVIAHRLSTVHHADKIIVLDEGRIVETGTHEQLMSNTQGIYYKLQQMQMY